MTAYIEQEIDFECCTLQAGEAGDSAESAPTGVDPVSPGYFPSEPISGDTKATVELVAHDWLAERDYARFEAACRLEAGFGSTVDPNTVRHMLTNEHGLTIEPRRYSAFWSRAAGKSGFLDFSHWGINGDTKGRNAGRPARIYKLRSNA